MMIKSRTKLLNRIRNKFSINARRFISGWPLIQMLLRKNMRVRDKSWRRSSIQFLLRSTDNRDKDSPEPDLKDRDSQVLELIINSNNTERRLISMTLTDVTNSYYYFLYTFFSFIFLCIFIMRFILLIYLYPFYTIN